MGPRTSSSDSSSILSPPGHISGIEFDGNPRNRVGFLKEKERMLSGVHEDRMSSLLPPRQDRNELCQDLQWEVVVTVRYKDMIHKYLETQEP